MAKQLNVNLAFTADTSQAKAKLQELQNTLTQIVNTPTSSFGVKMTKDIQSAVRSAAELKVHLQNATNANTGNLDFSKLNQSIKQSGTSLQEYSAKLQSLGASGQQAFMQLAQSVATAEIPIRRSNAALTEMWTTLKNTARWQISSSILHGFMGAVQSAYGYAQDLNESLNNIRIVTNKNIDEMAEFAEQANKAAKALSSTTTEYTDAALIYYQQGLEGKAVEERAETTLKLANVSRQSAEVVSDQMTAVWNNFYDGSKSLEYYADVMTALGAATASSTDEIAQGLEKFAAIADTVGLSYEYATAALATVTSETRQSADVVGTAFKTLFARIEGLSLGETLDDGTDLNKYSEALMTVGISIKDQNGNLRDMDSILNDMGDKWSSLSKDQQIALAQTVGGVRQYNQLISLMDNWDKFQQNLGTAYGSTGALQEQADIYAESWEAAQERVRAAAETIYSDLLNDEAFIDILNGVEKFLTLLDNIIDSMGGLQGVLAGVSALMLKVFSDQAAQGITNMAYSLQMMTKSGREKIQNEKKSFIDNAVNSIQVDETAEPNANTTRQNMLRAELEVQQELIDKAEKMSEIEKSTNQVLLDRQRTLAENAILAAEELDKAKKEKGDLSFDITTDVIAESETAGFEGKEAYEEFVKKDLDPKRQMLQNSVQIDTDITELVNQFNEGQISAEQFNDSLLKISQKATEIGDERLVKLIGALENGEQGSKELAAGLDEVQGRIKKIQNDNKKGIVQLGVDSKKVDKLIDSYYKEEKANKKSKKATEDANKAREQTSKSIEKSQGAQKKWSDTLVQSAQSVSSVVMGLSSLGAAWETLQNPDISGWEKVTSVLMSLSMGIPSLVSGSMSLINSFKGLGPATRDALLNLFSMTSANKLYNATIDEQISKTSLATIAKRLENGEDEKAIFNGIAEQAIKKGLIAEEEKEAYILALKLKFKKANVLETIKSTMVNAAHAASVAFSTKMQELQTAAEGKSIIVRAALTIKTLALAAAEAIKAAVQQLGWVGVAIGLAAAGAIVGGFIAINASINKAVDSNSEALENNSAAAQGLADSYDKAREAAEKFKETVSDYQTGIDELKELTKGTEEYEKKLKEVNEQALKLIDTYGLWGQYTIDAETGAYSINQDVLDDIQTKKDAIATDSRQSAIAGKALVANTKWNTSDAKEDMMNTFDSSLSGIYNYMHARASETFEDDGSNEAMADEVTVEKPTNEYGVEDVREAIMNSPTLFNANMSDEAFLSTIEQVLDETGIAFSDLGVNIEDVKKGLVEYKEELISTSLAQGEYNDEMRRAAEEIVAVDIEETQGEVLKQTFGNDEAKISAVTDIMAASSVERTNYDEVLAQRLEEAEIESMNADGGSDRNDLKIADEKYGGNISYEDLTKEYAKLQGYTEEELANVTFTDKDWKGTLKTEQGESILEGVLYEDMVRALKTAEIQAKVSEELGGQDQAAQEAQAKALGDMTDNLNNSVAGLGDAILTSMTAGKDENGNYSMDLSGVFGEFSSQAEIDQLMAMDTNELLAELGLDEETLKAAGYANAASFHESFAKGLSEWTLEDYETSVQQKADSIISSGAEKYELDEKVLKTQATLLQENMKELEGNAVAAAQLAVNNQRLNKGINTLSDGWEDWQKILTTGDKTTQEYAETLESVKGALVDVLGVTDSDFFSNDFFESAETLELIEKAAAGSEEAITLLGLAAAKANLEILEYSDKLNYDTLADGATNALAVTRAEFETSKQTVLNGVNELTAAVENGALAQGQALTDVLKPETVDSMLNGLNTMAMATNMTVDEMKEKLNSMGITADVTTETKMLKTKKPRTETTTKVIEAGDPATGDGRVIETTNRITGYDEVEEAVEVAQINMGDDAGTPPTFTGRGNVTPSVTTTSKSGGGGGSSSPAEKVNRTKKSDVVNRYEEVEDKLDDVRDAADRAAGAMDRLYGANRIKAMKDQAKALEDEVGLLKDKRKQAEQYLKEDTEALAKAATDAGIRFEFDENSNITNYTEQMTRLYDQLATAEAHMDTLGTKEEQDDYQETHVQPIQDAIDALKEEYDGYEETRELIEDLDTEIQEAIYAWQDANAEILNYEIELQVEMDDRELQKIEYYLGKMEDDFYASAESAALLGEKIALTQKSLTDNENNIARLKQMYDDGKISQAAYVEGLKEEESKMYDNLQVLQDYDKEMMNYYGETLDKAQEELTSYTDKMEHATSVLDHYRSLLDLTGQSQNFKAIGTILEGQAKTIENSYQIAKENYEWLADEAVKKKQAMNDALARGDAEAAELYENEWKAAEEKMRESQDNMLSMAEEWAGKLKEVLENKLAEIADVLENALTGGRSFDELSMQMEHAQGIQEEYLTTTNKIYETNKMIRNAQNEIDKTTNTVSKQKLKAFQQETQQLQNQGQLSQFELDIQQKKYDLLLAEIALEEAQNAKSTVRLQRDSEGNFGYVYTADQNQVSGAEQGVEDAENALYNTRLEGANNYASQRQELLQGLYDSLTNLDNQYYIEGTISEEEYNRQKEAIQGYYFERLAQNSELYAIATEEDATVSQEAWSTSLEIMDKDASDLVEAVDDYLSNAETAFNEYQTGINKVVKETGVDLDTLASNVKDIADESDNLKKKVKDEVIPELQNELDKVSEVTGNYALHREELQLVIEKYEGLITKIGTAITEMGKLDEACDNVKTSAEQAAAAVGNVRIIGAYDGSGDGGSSGGDGGSGGGDDGSGGGDQENIINTGFIVKNRYPMKDGTFIVYTSGGVYTKENNIKELGKDSNNYTRYDYKDRNKVYTKIERDGGLDFRGMPSYILKDKIMRSEAFDTGGYTGEWGPEGKLAWLHQKELVLNATQTEDLLMTMELLDSIIKQIDMMTMNNKISQMHTAMNQAVNAMYREQVAQEIHIEANFPNATDRNEIYQAFEMLANDTSQFINR